jgi:hypothetical protein
MSFNFSAANDEGALVTGIGAFVGGLALAHLDPVTAAEYAVLAALGVIGYTGYTGVPPSPAPAAAPASG